MLMKVSSWVWVLVLCCFCFSKQAIAGDWNSHTFNTDIDYYKDSVLGSGNYTLTDWQYFPSTPISDGSYTNDGFCFPIRNNDTGSYTIIYGSNGQQSCEWWGGIRPEYGNATYVDFYSGDWGGVQIDCSNPLNDASCPGYAEAYTELMCSTNPLYDQSCAGYQEAYFDMQCSANALYDQNCPGYAEAYFDQQCTADALYDANCPGYAEAYLAQQCSLDALYDTSCPGYQEAYALYMLEQQRSTASNVDDGSVDDGVPANDGSDIEQYTEVVIEEPVVVQEDTTQQESALTTDEAFVQQQATPEPTIEVQPTKQETVVVVEETQAVKEEPMQQETVAAVKEEPAQQEALEEANSLDLESMSPSQVVGALKSLGILGNDQTNGVGDPTGLSGGLEGTGGAISATGQVALPGLTPESSGNSQSSGGSSSGGGLASGGSYSPAGTPNAQTGTAGNTLTLDSNATSDPAVQSAEQIASGSADPSGTFGMSVPGVEGVPGLGGPGFGTVNSTYETTSSGVTDLEQEMGVNVNPLFTDPALSAGAVEMAGIQEERYETQAQRIIKERIRNMVEQTNLQQDDSNKDAEKLVAESIQDSIDEKMQELQVNPDQNQAEIVALMGANIEFNDYNKVELSDGYLPDQDDWYKDLEVPQNKSALRNGLAQQILHNKMVDSQYESEEVDINSYYKENE